MACAREAYAWVRPIIAEKKCEARAAVEDAAARAGVADGVIARDDRFGYVELASEGGVHPRQFINVHAVGGKGHVNFRVRQHFDLDSGEHIDLDPFKDELMILEGLSGAERYDRLSQMTQPELTRIGLSRGDTPAAAVNGFSAAPHRG